MRTKIILLFSFVSGLLLSCTSGTEKNDTSYTVFTGATIIDGNGGSPVTDAVLIIGNGKVIAMGTRADVEIPVNAKLLDVSGKTIIPGIINAHGHVGDVKGIEGGHYSKENIIDNLSIYARYGVTTVISLGNDKKDAEPFRAVHDTAPTGRARLYIAGDIISGKTIVQALAVIDSNAKMGVDFMKIRIDDQLGTTSKMPEEIYRDVIVKSHELGYKVAAHLYYLEDARKLVEDGADILAHSIRDLPVDDTTLQLIKSRGVGYIPTFTRELSTYVYEDTAAFFTDPFFKREYDDATIQPLLNPAKQLEIRNSKAAQTYKKQLSTAYANLKKLQDNGVIIIFGTDSGVPTRFIGYFEHLEMEMMQQAGLTPMQIIVSATKNAAEKFGLKNLGTLSPGNYADFIILNADPLADIKNVHQLSAVYIGGNEVKK